MENKEQLQLNSQEPKDVVTFFYDAISNENNKFERASMAFFEFGKKGLNSIVQLIEENEKLKTENELLKASKLEKVD
jgi:hypothetical protein